MVSLGSVTATCTKPPDWYGSTGIILLFLSTVHESTRLIFFFQVKSEWVMIRTRAWFTDAHCELKLEQKVEQSNCIYVADGNSRRSNTFKRDASFSLHVWSWRSRYRFYEKSVPPWVLSTWRLRRAFCSFLSAEWTDRVTRK